MKKLFFITSNKGKVKEASQKLSELDIKIVQKDLGYPEIQVDNLEDVADFGIDYVSKIFDQPFILEDAGLFIDSLKGFPGVYSAYAYHTVGCKGILRLLNDEKDRNAVFKSVYALKNVDGKKHFFVGECKGRISAEMLGENGFGYDPVFIPNGSDRTFAQMSVKEKNAYSHRGKSLDKLMAFLNKNHR